MFKNPLAKITILLILFLSACLTVVATGQEESKPLSEGLQNQQDLEQLEGSLSTETYNLVFSTYFGTSDSDNTRDIFVDPQGNIYIAGGTSSQSFPTSGTGTAFGSLGDKDAIVAKFDSEGSLLWSTVLGGPNHDRIYGIEVDDRGFVYVGGRAGPGFPVSVGAFQTTFQGHQTNTYGMQNAFVAKLSPDGSNLVWASYVGVGEMVRDLAIDSNSDVYVPLLYSGSGPTPPSSWFANAYQKTLKGAEEAGIAKIKSDGSKVIWATWLGGSSLDSAGSIRVDNNGFVFLGLSTSSNDFPSTNGSYHGGIDFFVAKLSPGGSNLLYGTYLGGSGNDWFSTHDLAIDLNGNAYVAFWTTSTDIQHTPNTVQPNFGGGRSDIAIAKLSPNGALLASTYFGGSAEENPDGVCVDSSGNLLITGESSSTDFLPPNYSGAYQDTNNGQKDTVLVRLSSDLKNLLYATYMGGSGDETGRSGFLGGDGSLYITGSSTGGWPILNAYQGIHSGDNDIVLAKFSIPAASPTSPPPGKYNYLPIIFNQNIHRFMCV